jgi:GLPGLI family protein
MKTLTIFLTFLLANNAFSQFANDKGKIFACSYNTIFNSRFSNGKMFRPYDSKLLISDSLSLFYTVANKETFAKQEGDDMDVYADTLFKIIKFPPSNLLVFSDQLFSKGKTKIYSDTLYPMKWELIKEMKMIDTLECFMAKTFFKGRKYIAWYCPKIAISDGPWKLGGLPGLIIEAYDENKNLQFTLKDIKISEPGIEFKKTLTADFASIPTYQDYLKTGNAFFKRIKEQMATTQSGNCVDCQTKSTIKIEMFENVFE